MDAQRITVQIADLLPPKKAAKYLGVSVMTLWRWRQGGLITPVMLDHTYFHINELNRVKALREEKNRGTTGGLGQS